MKKGEILKKRWERINQELKSMDCPVGLPKIRPYQDGAVEIVKIHDAYRKSNPFYWTITFEAKKPLTGEFCLYTMQFSKGMIIIPVLDGQILLKREHRPTTGKWTWELPRGYINLLVDAKGGDSEVIISSLFGKEGAHAFSGSPEIKEIIQLDEGVWEDTGRSVATTPIYVIRLSGDLLEQKKRKNQITWKTFPLEQVRRERILQDNHSIVALSRLIDAIDFDGVELGG